MSYEADLFDALSPLVGNRVHALLFPQPPASPRWPAIRFTFVDSVPIVDICGDGDDSTAEVRVQLDVVTAEMRGYNEHRALRLQVLAAMRAFSPPAILNLSAEEYDPETKTLRSVLDYTLHGSSV